MPTNFNETNWSFFICSPKVGQNEQLTDNKYTLQSPKVAINILKSSPKSSKLPKPNFMAPIAGKSS